MNCLTGLRKVDFYSSEGIWYLDLPTWQLCFLDNGPKGLRQMRFKRQDNTSRPEPPQQSFVSAHGTPGPICIDLPVIFAVIKRSFMFFSVFPCESLEVCAQESMVQC